MGKGFPDRKEGRTMTFAAETSVSVERSKGRRVYEDVKGVMTERFRIICQIWRHHGLGPLRITKRDGRGGRFKIVKTVNPDYKVAEAEGPATPERNTKDTVTPE